MDGVYQTQRIKDLKDKMLSEPRYASIEQALIITKTYQENEDDPKIIQRAKSLKAALEKMEIRVEPEELIVGNRTAGVRYGVDSFREWQHHVDKEFETLPTRPQDRFNVHQEDIETFRKVIKPYWEGKSLEDVLNQRYGKEINEIAKVVKINQKDHAQGHMLPRLCQMVKDGPQGLLGSGRRKTKDM